MDSDGNIFSSITDAGKYHKVNRKLLEIGLINILKRGLSLLNKLIIINDYVRY